MSRYTFIDGKLEDVDPIIVIFVIGVEGVSHDFFFNGFVVDVHMKNVQIPIAVVFSTVILVVEIALGVVKVELERNVASDGRVDDELVVLLIRWTTLESVVGL